MTMQPILEIQGLCKNYGGFRLSDVSFSLPHGYIMGLIGPNGAGKTTTLKLILNLARREAGRIRVFGLDNIDDEVLVKRRVGMVFDEPCFYQNVSLKKLKRATSLFYEDWNEDAFKSLADRFELPLDKKFKHLSQGLKTKFALARFPKTIAPCPAGADPRRTAIGPFLDPHHVGPG
jgi:ABC-2 type transport system ATP-binding protein